MQSRLRLLHSERYVRGAAAAGSRAREQPRKERYVVLPHNEIRNEIFGGAFA
jgi:hypothetical protein